MKKICLLYGVLLSTVFVACQGEEDLTASLKDVDRVATQIDLSKPIVKDLKDNFNLGLLYEYNATLDFVYSAETATAAAKWAAVEIPQIKSKFLDANGNFPEENTVAYQARVDAALTFVNESLFKYFKPNSFIASKMPYKVLLSESIYAGQDVLQEPISESDSRISSTGQFDLYSVYNSHSIVINVNEDIINATTNKVKNDNFYVFLSRIMDMHNLYDLVPKEFYEEKAPYYGQIMETSYRTELNKGSEITIQIIDKDWFFSKGFIDAKYFFNGRIGLGTVTVNKDELGNTISPVLRYTKGLRPTYLFVSGLKKDVRSYLNEMIHRNATEIDAFPAKTKNNMRLLINMFQDWGVDIVAFNPALQVLMN